MEALKSGNLVSYFLSVSIIFFWVTGFNKLSHNGCGQAAVAGFKVRKFQFNCMLIRFPDDRGEHSARNSACPLLATVGILLQTAEERFLPLSPAAFGFCPAFSSNKPSGDPHYQSRSKYSWLCLKNLDHFSTQMIHKLQRCIPERSSTDLS